MLSEAAAISDSITSSSLYDPWLEVKSGSSAQIIEDLKTCFEKAVDHRRVVKDTSEQWYALGAVRPSSGESPHQYGVRISTVVEEGKLIMCALLLPPVGLLDIVFIFLLHGREKRKRFAVQLSFRASSRFQVLLPVPENALLSMVPVLLLLWHLNVPKEKHGKVGEIEKLHQSFKEECHECYCLFGH